MTLVLLFIFIWQIFFSRLFSFLKFIFSLVIRVICWVYILHGCPICLGFWVSFMEPLLSRLMSIPSFFFCLILVLVVSLIGTSFFFLDALVLCSLNNIIIHGIIMSWLPWLLRLPLLLSSLPLPGQLLGEKLLLLLLLPLPQQVSLQPLLMQGLLVLSQPLCLLSPPRGQSLLF